MGGARAAKERRDERKRGALQRGECRKERVFRIKDGVNERKRSKGKKSEGK